MHHSYVTLVNPIGRCRRRMCDTVCLIHVNGFGHARPVNPSPTACVCGINHNANTDV